MVAICALSDATLITLGVAGVGAVVVAWPSALTVVALTGGVFLLGYGASPPAGSSAPRPRRCGWKPGRRARGGGPYSPAWR